MKNALMKKTLFFLGLIAGVSLVIVGIGYLFYTQIEYVDLVGKRVFISETGSNILVEDDEGGVVLNYSLSQWRSVAQKRWDEYFPEGIEVDEIEITPSSFTRFIAVSAFPGGTKMLGFSVATPEGEGEASLFWLKDISTNEVRLIGDINKGSVGNISWSSDGSYFAYYLNTDDGPGEYLTVDNTYDLEKEFTLSGDDILTALGAEEHGETFHPDFRELEWEDGERILFFTTTSPDEEKVRWSVVADGSNLQKISTEEDDETEKED